MPSEHLQTLRDPLVGSRESGLDRQVVTGVRFEGREVTHQLEFVRVQLGYSQG